MDCNQISVLGRHITCLDVNVNMVELSDGNEPAVRLFPVIQTQKHRDASKPGHPYFIISADLWWDQPNQFNAECAP